MRSIRLIVSVYLLLLLAAFLVDNAFAWGVYHLTFLPAWLAWSLIVLAFALLWLPDRLTIAAERKINRRLSPRAEVIVLALFLVSSVALFVLARSRVLLFGDSFKLLAQITEPLIFIPTEQLNLLLHSFMYRLTADPGTAYLVVSVACGVFFLIIASLFVARVTERMTGRLAGIATFLGLAQIQFFFGYVENYAMMTAFVCLFLFLGWLSLRIRRYIWWTYAALVAAGAFHLSAWFLLPGLLFLLWTYGQGGSGLNRYRAAALVTLLVAIAGGILFYVKFEGSEIFCPLFATESNPYSLFSLQHLTDVANLLLLIAPCPLMLLVAFWWKSGFRDLLKSRQTAFLIICTAGGLFLLFFVDPKLGAVRDWDLLSLFGIPITFLTLSLWLGSGKKHNAGMTILRAALAVLIAHTVPWIGSNTGRELILGHMKRIILEDVHFSGEYYQGDRCMAWGLMLEKSYGDLEEQRRCFKIRAYANPEDHRAWVFYTWSCYKLGLRDEARKAARNINRFDGLTQEQLEGLAEVNMWLSDFDAARQVLSYVAENRSESYNLLSLYGLLYQYEGDSEKASDYYGRALPMKPDDINLLLNYAMVALETLNLELAKSLLNRAGSLPNLSQKDKSDIAALRQALGQMTDEAEASDEGQ